MKQESINKALDIIIEQIGNSDIEPLDKMELLLNLNHFLTNYEKTTKSPVEPTQQKEVVKTKEPYRWNYTIKIKTKEGSFEYEKDNVLDAVKLAEKHPDYEEFYMEHKPKTLSKAPNKPFKAPNKPIHKG